MKKILIILIATVQSFLLQGQDFKTSGKLSEIVDYKPLGYSILDTTSGDLNRDSYKDMIIIYETDPLDEKEPFRPLLIYIGKSDGTLKLTAKNDKVVYSYYDGGTMGDPLSQVVIKNGYFTVEHYGGTNWARWTRLVTFKYSSNDSNWYLHRDGGDFIKDPITKTTEIRTIKDFGIIPFEKFDNSKNYE